MSFLRAFIGGIFGSVVGAAIWLAASNFAHAELGFMAILVGGLAGYGVKRACCYFEVNFVHGLIACVCALLAIAAAKYSWIAEQVEVAKTELAQVEPPRDELISCLALRLREEIAAKGQMVASAEPSPAVLQVAEEFLDELDPSDRQPFVERALGMRAVALGFPPDLLTENIKEVTRRKFINSFEVVDLAWMAIALGLSLKVGSTEVVDDYDDYEEDEDSDEESEFESGNDGT